ncbi:hypothetical protein [Halobaculum sp. MBLA0143]|uniref:hypothetical protein n=1 Tax=Halobaculum sp. MBLA0143 TaxID=3079933 RepID=UPI0035252796
MMRDTQATHTERDGDRPTTATDGGVARWQTTETPFGPDAERDAPLVPDLSGKPETDTERVGRNPLELALMEDAE